MEAPKNAKRMQGCGNTFIVVDDTMHPIEVSSKDTLHAADMAEAKSKMRELGFQPDGFLFVHASLGLEQFVMKYYDVDRKSGEMMHENMCGNGIRCFARYVFDSYGIESPIPILTDDGMKKAYLHGSDIMVEMGPAREYQVLEKEGVGRLHFMNTSLAHIVMFLDQLDIHDEETIARYTLLGRELRHDQGLMDKVGHDEGLHVNFASVGIDGDVSLLTYEVGVESITLACGTGSAATAYAAHMAFGIVPPVKVMNRGGMLKVDIKGDELYLTGPAEYM